jgi:hypothetical protein
MPHRKIPAIRGLLWCLEAWRLLRASPQPVFSMAMWLSLGLLLPGLNLAVVILLTVFYGGVISTLHKKALAEKVVLSDFFNGFKSLQRFLGLLSVGFPTMLFGLFSGYVLMSALGPDVAQRLTQPGQPPSKEIIEAIIPVISGVITTLLPVGIVIGWVVFLAVPRVMLDKRLAFAALWDALRAIFTNIGALLLFSFGMIAAVIVISFLLAIPLALLSGAGAVAQIFQTFVLVFISTFGWALYLNAMYIAWRDIFMSDAVVPIATVKNTPDMQIEV